MFNLQIIKEEGRLKQTSQKIVSRDRYVRVLKYTAVVEVTFS
jgi:hypothetical protein